MSSEQHDRNLSPGEETPQRDSPAEQLNPLEAAGQFGSEGLPGDPEAFVQEWMELYLDGETSDDNLWEWFREEFCDWTLQTFQAVGQQTRKKLKERLKRNGVLVGGNGKLPDQLFRLLQEETPAVWSREELEKEVELAERKGGKWNSRWHPDNVAALAKIYKEADEKFPGIITRATAPGAILPTIRLST